MIDLTPTVGRNLALLRKYRGLTQGQLADIFSYSDKAISKWERGEALPDLNTLYELAEFYGVTLDFLTHPQSEMTLRQLGENDPRKVKSNKLIIVALAVVSVWTVATIIYVSALLIEIPWNGWTMFVWAVPISIVIIGLFNKFWGHKEWKFGIWTTVVWTLLLATYIEMGNSIEAGAGWELAYIMIAGIPITLVAFLIHRLRINNKNNSAAAAEQEKIEEEKKAGDE